MASDPEYEKPISQTLQITVTGRALNEKKESIAGATVYLVSTNSIDRLLGQTTTDADGKYEFKEIGLPVPKLSTPGFIEAGCFQVFGRVPGRSFAWCGMKYVFPKDSTGGRRDDAFVWGDPINLDLTFPTPKAIQGRFVDEEGAPVAGVKINLANCDYADPTGHESHKNSREFRAIQQAREVMPEMLTRTSDADGRFTFEEVPPELICWLLVEHEKFANMSLYTSTARRPPKQHDQHPVEPLPLAVTLKSVRTIPVTVVSADTGELMSGINVSGYQQRASGFASYGTSDDNGEVTLKLPRGAYRLLGDPPRTSDFVRTYQELRVTDTPAVQPITLKMNSGCVLKLKTIDVDTGKGIANVGFWYVPDNQPNSRTSVQSSTTYVDHPRTNEEGELRAVVLPGKRVYGIGFSPIPDGYEVVNPEDRSKGRMLELPGGKTITEEFKLRKK